VRKYLAYAKAIAALLGAIITALLGVLPPDEYKWLVVLGVVLTAVATYRIPNLEGSPDGTT
jgi:hypothetical protein